MNHSYFPNQQLRCAPWVNVFHRNYSQNFFREHLRQHWNITNLSFHTYVRALLANNSCTEVPTPGVRPYSYLWIVFGIMALPQLPPHSLKPLLLMVALYLHPKGSALLSEQPERLPRKGHNLRWTWVPIFFKAEFSEEMKQQAVIIETPQLLRKVPSKENHIRVRKKSLKCNKVKYKSLLQT